MRCSADHLGLWCWVLIADSGSLPVWTQESRGDGWSRWDPTIGTGELCWISGSQLHPRAVLDIVGVSWQMEICLFLFLCLSLCFSHKCLFKEKKKFNHLRKFLTFGQTYPKGVTLCSVKREVLMKLSFSTNVLKFPSVISYVILWQEIEWRSVGFFHRI